MDKHIYAEIAKSEPQDDGTIKVWGYASSPSEDSDGETITADAIAAALPEYMKFGCVREMHQAKAAGTALEATVQDDGRTWFGAHIVDSQAVKKVQAKVYKGFSIGGKVLKRDEADINKITEIKLVEVSLVDRPANPDAVFTMFKADGIDQPTGRKDELSAIDQLTVIVNKGDITPSKLVELAQSFIKGDLEVKKSFWNVADLAHILGCLKSLQSSVAFDAAYEGEVSEVDAQLKKNIAELSETLALLVSEEAMAEESAKMAKAAKAEDEPSDEAKGDEEAPKDSEGSEEAPAEGDESKEEAPKDEGAEDEDKEAEKSAKSDDLSKSDDFLTKVASAVKSALEPLEKRLAHLEGQPAPSKAVLKTVGKADDVTKGDNADEDAPPAGSTPEQVAAWEIKKMHRTGGLI